jgi:hypothetical protein
LGISDGIEILVLELEILNLTCFLRWSKDMMFSLDPLRDPLDVPVDGEKAGIKSAL